MEEISNKAPSLTFLKVLLVLSAVSIFSGLYTTVSALISGPLSSEQVEEFMAEQMQNVKIFRDQGADDVVDMLISAAELTVYQNNHVFYSFNLITLLTLLVGLAGIYMMYKLNKLGFHLYIIYSILPVLTLYLVIPMDMIPNFLVFGTLLISAFFCIMYATQLKHMRQ